jgi:hypothetical protein
MSGLHAVLHRAIVLSLLYLMLLSSMARGVLDIWQCQISGNTLNYPDSSKRLSYRILKIADNVDVGDLSFCCVCLYA